MVDVLIPLGLRPPEVPEAAPIVWGTAAELAHRIAERSTNEPFVLVSDGLAAEAAAEIARVVERAPTQVIEVRYERWDGESRSPLSAACRGVISGFGAAGVAAAVALLAGNS